MIIFRILSKLLCGKIKQNLFVECMFCITLKESVLGRRFYFFVKVHKLYDSFIFIRKNIRCYIFLFLCNILSFGSSGLNCKFILREYGFSINSKISFMSSGDKPILTLKISVTNFFRFQYFTDFDIRIVLFGQNNLLLNWVLCILNLYWSFKVACVVKIKLFFYGLILLEFDNTN